MASRVTGWIEELGRIPAGPRHRLGALALSAALLLAIGVADYYAPYQVQLSVLYLAPIFLATWRVGTGAGIAMAVASALAITGGDILAGLRYPSWLLPAATLAFRSALFLAFVLLLRLLRDALERERTSARTDELTGVPNRRSFIELLTSDLYFARRYRRALTIVYLDLDDFKNVNDRLGHRAGDAVLRAVASSIRSRLRYTDAVGRLGGDEFAICLPETDADAASHVMDTIRREVAAALPRETGTVTLSIGMVTFGYPPMTVEELLDRADFALYAAKREGKNRLIHEVVPA